MGFSGSGSNVTMPHTHSSAIVNDGGALQFDNVTQATLSAGDLNFSDGNALQRLAIGTPAQTLVVNPAGNAPEWGGAGGATIAVQTTWNTATFTTTAGTPTDVTSMTLTGTSATGFTIVTSNGSVSSPFGGHVMQMYLAAAGSQIGVGNYEKSGTTPLGGYNQFGITSYIASAVQTYTYQILTSNSISEARVQGAAAQTVGCNFSIMEIA